MLRSFYLPSSCIHSKIRKRFYDIAKLSCSCNIFSAVKGSHVLIDENGTVRLTGLRESHCLSPNGYNHAFAYDFPLHAVASLPWLAPEVLEQVCLKFNYFHHFLAAAFRWNNCCILISDSNEDIVL